MSTMISPSGRRSRRSVDSATTQAAGAEARRGPYLLALLLLSLFAWAPLLYPGYIQVHSGFLPVFNLADLAASPSKLTWLPTIGTTPDLLRGEGPLAYWLALPLRCVAGDVGAIKGVFALSIIAVGLGMFTWARRDLSGFEGEPAGVEDTSANPKGLLASRAGLLAAMVAMLWPPLLATVYVRGALGEVVFMALVPWALWAVSGVRCQVSGVTFQVSRGRWPSRAGIAGALVAALFWTQAGLALWATALLLVWALWPGAPRRGRGIAAAAVAFGALLGGGLFWLLHSGQAQAGQPPDVAAHAVYLYQLFSPAWGFGVSTPGWQDALPLQLGLAALGLAALTVVLGLGSKRLDDQAARSLRPVLLFTLIATVVVVLLTTTLARPLWRNLPALAATLSYPWQLFALVSPLLALLAGAVVVVERRLVVLPVWAAAVALVMLSSYPYLAPRFTQVTPDSAAPTILGAGQVMLVAGDVSPLTPNLSPLRGEGSLTPRGSSTPAPSPSEGEGWGEGETPTTTTLLTVTLSWQALQPIDFDYNVFAHAVDAEGNRVAQWDGQPTRDGEPYPMTAWSVGEIVGNSYRLDLDPAAAPVRRVDVGLYNWQTGERLPVNGDDRVTLEVGP